MPEDTLRQLNTLPLPDLFQLIQIGIGVLQVGIGGLGLSAIFWGLIQMQKAGRRRDREIDVLAETMRESTRVLGESLERQGQLLGQTLGQVGQALDRQSQALERQGQALDRQGQALEQQSQVLAELLRRGV